MRELKLGRENNYHILIESHPLRVRELKLVVDVHKPYYLLSHPLRVRELKHVDPQDYRMQLPVAPFTGA